MGCMCSLMLCGGRMRSVSLVYDNPLSPKHCVNVTWYSHEQVYKYRHGRVIFG